MTKPITILQVAIARGAKTEEGAIDGTEFERVNLCMIGGCASCQAVIAAYNAYPGRNGFWLCADCIGDDGFDTTEQFEQYEIQEHERRRTEAEQFQTAERLWAEEEEYDF